MCMISLSVFLSLSYLCFSTPCLFKCICSRFLHIMCVIKTFCFCFISFIFSFCRLYARQCTSTVMLVKDSVSMVYRTLHFERNQYVETNYNCFAGFDVCCCWLKLLSFLYLKVLISLTGANFFNKRIIEDCSLLTCD